jgi:hypothetical protein
MLFSIDAKVSFLNEDSELMLPPNLFSRNASTLRFVSVEMASTTPVKSIPATTSSVRAVSDASASKVPFSRFLLVPVI